MLTSILQNFYELIASEPLQQDEPGLGISDTEQESKTNPLLTPKPLNTPLRFTDSPPLMVKEPTGYVIATNEANEEVILEVSVNDKFSNIIEVNSDKEKEHYYI
jgi:hypothetical protein